MTDLTRDLLKQLIHYDPDTGIFVRKSGHKGKTVSNRCTKGYLAVFLSLPGLKKAKRFRGHQLAWLYVYGELPKSQVDHINGDKTDNRIANLRLTTQSGNNANRNLDKRSTTRAKGVSRAAPGSDQYRAKIYVNKKCISLGRFDTVDEAAHAYNKAAIKYFGEFARLNPIGEDYVR